MQGNMYFLAWTSLHFVGRWSNWCGDRGVFEFSGDSAGDLSFSLSGVVDVGVIALRHAVADARLGEEIGRALRIVAQLAAEGA